MNGSLACDRNYSFNFHRSGIEPWILAILKNHGCEGNVLDIGCGYGFWGFLLKTHLNHHGELIGLDINRDRLVKLQSMKIYDMVILGDAANLPFQERMFQKVLSIEVLHVFINEQVLNDLERVARLSGCLVMTFPKLTSKSLRKMLIMHGYRLYASKFRSFFLINLKNGKIISMYENRSMKAIKLILKLLPLNKPYLIAFKV